MIYGNGCNDFYPKQKPPLALSDVASNFTNVFPNLLQQQSTSSADLSISNAGSSSEISNVLTLPGNGICSKYFISSLI